MFEPAFFLSAVRFRWGFGCLAIWIACSTSAIWGQNPASNIAAPVVETPRIPYGKSAVDYFRGPTTDSVAQLRQALESGEKSLAWEEQRGYLASVLQELDVPVESQLLVFSKTSLQTSLIEPRKPRALYFNDQVYVGWAVDSPKVELAAVDARQGTIFYTLSQDRARPSIERDDRCLLCHSSTFTQHVPGTVVKSFVTDLTGAMKWGYSRISQDSPISQRWGGWYVTGAHGDMPHLGNLVGEDEGRRHAAEPSFRGAVTDLREFCEIDRYLAPHSDLPALLVLEHQVQAQNWLTRLNFESRLAIAAEAEGEDAAGFANERTLESLLRCLLFVDAPRLNGPIVGQGAFAQQFAAAGPRDGQGQSARGQSARGRSLRELDLQTRLLRYPLSYLIYSPQVAALPEASRRKLGERLRQILTGEDVGAPFDEQRLPALQRAEILEILQGTRERLPAEWTWLTADDNGSD